MTTRVKALYTFTGEPSTSEISIEAGEILILTRTDVGEGWWEGTNSKGQTGLFPEAYVELYKEPAVPVAPPPANNLHHGVGAVLSPTETHPPVGQAPRYDQSAEDWNDMQDDWEDDWDDDNDTYSEIGPPPSTAAATSRQNVTRPQQPASFANAALPSLPSMDDGISMASGSSAPVKKSGMFSKAGDSYILGTTTVAVADHDRVFIVQIDNGYFWKHVCDPYTVRVASPKKETKFKGMKSFIAYQLTPSFNNIAVSRRYKHFDWLHERLVDKFCLIPIPPLPDKQISGRYEEQFIEHRRVQLQGMNIIEWPRMGQMQCFVHSI